MHIHHLKKILLATDFSFFLIISSIDFLMTDYHIFKKIKNKATWLLVLLLLG